MRITQGGAGVATTRRRLILDWAPGLGGALRTMGCATGRTIGCEMWTAGLIGRAFTTTTARIEINSMNRLTLVFLRIHPAAEPRLRPA